MTAHKDKPAPGKLYAITGDTKTPSLANGNTWKDSQLTQEQLDLLQIPIFLRRTKD